MPKRFIINNNRLYKYIQKFEVIFKLSFVEKKIINRKLNIKQYKRFYIYYYKIYFAKSKKQKLVNNF